LNDLYGGKFPIAISLGIIIFVIGASIGLSLLFPKEPTELEKRGMELATETNEPADALDDKSEELATETSEPADAAEEESERAEKQPAIDGD
jgi:hypothetical protein